MHTDLKKSMFDHVDQEVAQFKYQILDTTGDYKLACHRINDQQMQMVQLKGQIAVLKEDLDNQTKLFNQKTLQHATLSTFLPYPESQPLMEQILIRDTHPINEESASLECLSNGFQNPFAEIGVKNSANMVAEKDQRLKQLETEQTLLNAELAQLKSKLLNVKSAYGKPLGNCSRVRLTK